MVGKSDSIRAAGGEAGRTGVRAVPGLGGYLQEVIQTITSGPDLEAILGGVVRVVTEATRCDACFISLLQDNHLVVRAASGTRAELEGKPTTANCGGVPEWVARTRRSVLIHGNAFDDPRAVRIPELDPELFHSLASVPISSGAGDAIGTITLHAEAPHRFCQADVDFLERVAGLVAAAVDNARLYTEATTKDALIVGLSGLAEQIAECRSVDEILVRMPTICRPLLGATRCEVYLLEGEQRLVLRAADPARPAEAAFDTRRLWLEVVSGRRPARAPHATPVPETSDAAALARILWGEGLTETPLFAPLVVRGELLGLLAVLVARPTSHARRAFSAAASIVAIALQNNRLQEDDLVRDFFEALGSAKVDPEDVACRAAKLRVDPEVPYVALHAAPWPPPLGEWRSRLPSLPRSLTPLPPWSTVADEIVARLLEALPGAVFDRRQGAVRGFLKAAPLQYAEILKVVRLVHTAVTAQTTGPCSIGLSGLCRGPEAFQHGLHQAMAAAEVGALTQGAPGVFTHEDLGPYRYLLSAEVPDCRQQGLEALAHHDRDRGSRLFETLESYLDNKGNVVGTSRALGIHQNTLRQRLTRIERVAGLNPDQQDWLSMAMALKVVKLRLLRARAQEQYGAGGGAGLAPRRTISTRPGDGSPGPVRLDAVEVRSDAARPPYGLAAQG